MYRRYYDLVERGIKVSSLSEYKPDCNVNRLYIGDDCCERLIPEVPVLDEIISYASRENKKITFLTPYCTEQGIGKLHIVFDILNRSGIDIEVVINDMGVLRILNDNYVRLIPVFGRLNTSKLLHPYADPVGALARVSSTMENNLDDTHSIADGYLRYLQENNIFRVEFDNILSTLLFSNNFWDRGIHVTLYYPYTFIFTTRRCIFASLQEVSTKFALLGCDKECLYHNAVLQDKHNNSIFAKGNAFFIRQEETPNASKILKEIMGKKLVDRIVNFII